MYRLRADSCRTVRRQTQARGAPARKAYTAQLAAGDDYPTLNDKDRRPARERIEEMRLRMEQRTAEMKARLERLKG